MLKRFGFTLMGLMGLGCLAITGLANPTLNAIDALITQKAQSTGQAITPTHTRLRSSPRYALVLFFSSRCVHCQRFTPGFMQLAHQDHLQVYAYSVDGGTLPAISHPLMATPAVIQAFYRGQPVAVPTVFAMNTQTMAYQLLSQGEVTEPVMAQKLATIVALNQQAMQEGGQ